MERYELEVDGMTCKSCEKIVQDEVTALSGVATVDADSDADVVRVTGEPGIAAEVDQAIEDAGYLPDA